MYNFVHSYFQEIVHFYIDINKKEGLIEFIREYIPAQFSYEGELERDAFWNIGWRTTKKALKDKIWKQEKMEEERIRKEVWGD
ncbi:MAG: hypothetical protein J6A04_03235 [Clostridia bacterium]|nr:hypothetical protein [Clostridia bacterium]